jgi:hypothetical protein
LIVTTILLPFQALKEKDVLMVEEVLTETPSKHHCKIAVDIDVTKIVREHLTMFEGQDAAETIADATRDNVEEEERAKV